ncbi:glycosyltransferase family 2 protein [Candidatus Desulforudis audaxviator]|uniref:Glucosyl-3-phosphoglycerate synthase n=1 Tax=Desulforudis audaxviator (strain MP104C) TaxID=477974 RepID=B1I564_DESAP|nr:glycosyltransferase family 2 protein [Candidatus Desulforudis audaxviator]ACA60114.1 glycosyl transferase, family 2 [Candidatus Desulforudis audaxviator MP104C]AZK60150.1 Glucosyl-3-phosphoglycerate synthase [Candidatus Desulforudis audaxviator]
MSATGVSVVIPAFNEGRAIARTVAAVRNLPGVSEVIVVDDCSTDDTAARARDSGARVVSLPVNRGKGAALNAGIAAAGGEVIVLLDADLGDSAAEAHKLILPILEGRADLTIARFPAARRRGGFGLVKGLARRGIRHFTGLEMESPISGQRAVRRELLSQLLPLAGGYGVEVGMTIDAAVRGYRLLEVPVQMRHRETGRNWRGFVHRGRQFRDIMLTLIRRRIQYRKRTAR